MQFRQKALAKLQSPEELDVPVRFARPQGWLVLTVTVLVMAVAGFWSVTGSVSPELSAPGILTHAEGSYVLQSPVAGQITAVFANEGDVLPSGARLLSVRTDQKVVTVRTVAAGRVTALAAKIGAVVTTGADLATVERIDNANDPLVAVLYAPASGAPTVPVGSPVDLTVQSVPAQRFGVLRGRVLAVGRVPETRQQITSFLGDSQLGDQFSAQGQPVAVMVQLDRSTSTRSGYTWSSAGGPPYAIDSTTLVSGAIHLAAQRPIDWLLP
ncbi:HlyD family efflux transporter periplasmic adaptor subunit [Streptantibioticus ferralitis]|uniref:HlyD family efflux transporter periplasmic adaptor subunit n=1 Tax=Streptantibioticus ferralitis TaxID=236510 RepID=A0ABT5YXT8_9ACTN|nr:HlyD family efflux transporter periplasmic adaptor subunit [Streptantibioticus ferralitis]MDF2255645.1 HlyD family efflux transporter periplasmic adaptor subunit [Streptantibioticus ferralitis]